MKASRNTCKRMLCTPTVSHPHSKLHYNIIAVHKQGAAAKLLCQCRYLGQLLDGEDAVASIRKGVEILQRQVETLVNPSAMQCLPAHCLPQLSCSSMSHSAHASGVITSGVGHCQCREEMNRRKPVSSWLERCVRSQSGCWELVRSWTVWQQSASSCYIELATYSQTAQNPCRSHFHPVTASCKTGLHAAWVTGLKAKSNLRERSCFIPRSLHLCINLIVLYCLAETTVFKRATGAGKPQGRATRAR